MLIKALIIFSTLLCAIFTGIYLHNESGYIVLVLRDYTIETSVWVLILGLVVFALSLYIFMLIINKIINIPNSLRRWKRLISLHSSQEKTRQGLIEFNEGHWQRAKKNLIDALPNAETPLLNYLTAARAAQEMGDNTQRDDFLRQAQQSMPEAKVAVELTQAQLQIANRQWEQALATLQHLQSLSPKHPYVLKLLLELYEEIKDWQQLIKLLPIIKRYKLIANDVFSQKQQNAYFHELKSLVKQKNETFITEFIQNLPKDLKYNAQINCIYAEFLIKAEKHKQSENLLRRLLRKNQDNCLLLTYAQLTPDIMDLKFIESLPQNNNSIIKYCLGKICVAKKLWGKAQHYLEESIQTNPSQEAYQELGMLLENENKPQEALQAYRQGLTSKSILK